MHKFLFTFQTTHQALTGEKKFRIAGIPSRLIPTPTEIFAECGFSLEAELEEEQIEAVLQDTLWNYAECYIIAMSEARSRIYEKIYPGCP